VSSTVVVVNPATRPVHVARPSDDADLIVLPVPGAPGAAGASGDPEYAHHQTAPASTWNITHNLGKHAVPVILLDDDPTRPVFTDADVTDDDHCVLTFPSPVTGWAYFN
jgi:hypothetical protein